MKPKRQHHAEKHIIDKRVKNTSQKKSEYFFFIKAPFVWIGDGQQLAIMGPAQFARQCLAFLIGQIKLPHILQV